MRFKYTEWRLITLKKEKRLSLNGFERDARGHQSETPIHLETNSEIEEGCTLAAERDRVWRACVIHFALRGRALGGRRGCEGVRAMSYYGNRHVPASLSWRRRACARQADVGRQEERTAPSIPQSLPSIHCTPLYTNYSPRTTNLSTLRNRRCSTISH